MGAADLSAVQLGFHLARLRESSDLKQIELARRVTMSPSTFLGSKPGIARSHRKSWTHSWVPSALLLRRNSQN